MIKKDIAVKAIVDFLGSQVLEIKGNIEGISIDNVADVEHTNATTLDWINHSKTEKEAMALKSPAKVIIVDPTVTYTDEIAKAGKVFIVVNKPRMIIAKVMTEFFLPKYPGCIHPSAIIDDDAQVDPTANIGAGVVIGKAKIGAHTVIKPNVVIYDDVTIGDDCLIQAGAVIGTDGLGCMREADGSMVKFPHLGGVVIGNKVEIGANCQIAKGVLSDTLIKDGCKINGLSFIAHNCILDENVWITGDTMLCGTTRVGKNTTIFSNVIVRDQAHIGEKCTIGMGSVITKDVPDGETWFGAPAKKKEK